MGGTYTRIRTGEGPCTNSGVLMRVTAALTYHNQRFRLVLAALPVTPVACCQLAATSSLPI